jgi:2,4-dienoyl-CoA reductase-like NADH-dependent reductase (Old Yellow Enzyme family)
MPSFLEKCYAPATLNRLTLRNRFIKAGTFEGMTPGGVPGQQLLEFHREFALGGLGMTTLGYCATEADGRLNENMMYMHEGIRSNLSSLIDGLHKAGTKVSGQMGHCGGFTKNRELQRARAKGPSFGLNLLGAPQGMVFCEAMSEGDIRAMVQTYYDAAVFMKSVGFDALEIHYGHGYGLCQFMSPKTNRRKDRYGGSVENRMRLPLQVLEAVRKAVGDDFPIIGKISMFEGVKGGLSFEDTLEMSKLFDKGGIDGLITSAGTSTMSPMLMLHGDNILRPMLKAEADFKMRVALRVAGTFIFKDFPYRENYFLNFARQLREQVDCNLIYIGGACNAQSFETLMREGFDFIQLGRALLRDPSLPKKLKLDRNYQNLCDHCNECIATIEHPNGIHCTKTVKHVSTVSQ